MALKPAFTGPYVDPNITFRNPDAVDLSDILPAKNQTNLGDIEVYDLPDRQESGFDEVDPPPNPPTPWVPGYNPYANDGMPGQDFFKNQG